MSEIQKCGNCRFVVRQVDPNNLKGAYMCRRNPPNVVTMMQQLPGGQMAQGLASYFPPVQEEQWCGQYEFSGSGVVTP